MPLTRVIKRQTLVELFQAGTRSYGDKVQTHFGQQLVDYTQADGKVYAHFADGSTVEGDVLVGACCPPDKGVRAGNSGFLVFQPCLHILEARARPSL
ncbi:hypothetical protein T492DRAFT_136594 [Pavlovales sp. CCMP2436]|nr:hypothetical protein T492DRAFT_136594 [Pavlovales sp. CCMP2436]